jgi:hypothetical protein
VTRWIVDDGPLSMLANFVGVSGFLKKDGLELLVASQTSIDAARYPPRSIFVEECGLVTVFSIERVANAAAFDTLHGHLGQRIGNKTNLAERQRIAWALTEAPMRSSSRLTSAHLPKHSRSWGPYV